MHWDFCRFSYIFPTVRVDNIQQLPTDIVLPAFAREDAVVPSSKGLALRLLQRSKAAILRSVTGMSLFAPSIIFDCNIGDIGKSDSFSNR